MSTFNQSFSFGPPPKFAPTISAKSFWAHFVEEDLDEEGTIAGLISSCHLFITVRA
jgi:hypothetical protein